MSWPGHPGQETSLTRRCDVLWGLENDSTIRHRLAGHTNRHTLIEQSFVLETLEEMEIYRGHGHELECACVGKRHGRERAKHLRDPHSHV